MNVILSVKPKYVEPIVAGRKRYEFRKTLFKRERVETVFIYSSNPVKRIVGSFEVGRIYRNRPEILWETFNGKSGLSRDEFFGYFDGSQYGYAVEIQNLKVFEPPVDPRVEIPDFKAPQNFCYTHYPDLIKHSALAQR